MIRVNTFSLLAITFLFAAQATAILPARVFSPYVDVTLEPTPVLPMILRDAGVKYFTLAFVNADGEGRPAWGGEDRIDGKSKLHQMLLKQIAQIRSAGGDVTVSFGGEGAHDLASLKQDPGELAEAYRLVIDAYHLTRIDLDIEDKAIRDTASIDRRSAALAELQKHNPELAVWFTLPTETSGLTRDGLRVVKSAMEHRVTVAGVNVMAMDFGSGPQDKLRGKMGQAAIDSVTASQQQLRDMWKSKEEVWSKLGVTVMIGQNDVRDELFEIEDAKKVLDFAKEKKLGMLSFWSLSRDHAGKAGKASEGHSGLQQMDFEFSKMMAGFGE